MQTRFLKNEGLLRGLPPICGHFSTSAAEPPQGIVPRCCRVTPSSGPPSCVYCSYLSCVTCGDRDWLDSRVHQSGRENAKGACNLSKTLLCNNFAAHPSSPSSERGFLTSPTPVPRVHGPNVVGAQAAFKGTIPQRVARRVATSKSSDTNCPTRSTIFSLSLHGCLSSLCTLPQRRSFSGQASKSQAAVK